MPAEDVFSEVLTVSVMLELDSEMMESRSGDVAATMVDSAGDLYDSVAVEALQ